MQLKNEHLTVEFAKGFENQRFDCTAVVSQVVLDGKYAFCVPEQVRFGRRSTGGLGLCGEFVLAGAAEEAKAGEWFAKPGVGLLRQTGDGAPYDMWQPYERRPFAVEAECDGEKAFFRQKGVPTGGYGVEIEKAFSLAENSLILEIRVRNVGTKECRLEEYQHNFLSLDGLPVGEGYALELPCDEDLPEIERKTLRQGDEISLPSAVRLERDGVYWKTDMEGRVLYHRSEQVKPEPPYGWSLRHLRSPASVTERTEFRPSRIDVWAVEHCICTELYNSVILAPGETALWRRIWTFSG